MLKLMPRQPGKKGNPAMGKCVNCGYPSMGSKCPKCGGKVV